MSPSKKWYPSISIQNASEKDFPDSVIGEDRVFTLRGKISGVNIRDKKRRIDIELRSINIGNVGKLRSRALSRALSK